MAGTAGLALFHVLHGRRIGAALGGEHIRMALRTGELLIMHRMREGDLAYVLILKGDINRLTVTGPAIAFNAEGHGAVMTGAAGLALFHILHGRRVGTAFGGEHIRMALRTGELLIMQRVGEGDLSDILVLKRDIYGLAVTAGTVALNAEGR